MALNIVNVACLPSQFLSDLTKVFNMLGWP